MKDYRRRDEQGYGRGQPLETVPNGERTHVDSMGFHQVSQLANQIDQRTGEAPGGFTDKQVKEQLQQWHTVLSSDVSSVVVMGLWRLRRRRSCGPVGNVQFYYFDKRWL